MTGNEVMGVCVVMEGQHREICICTGVKGSHRQTPSIDKLKQSESQSIEMILLNALWQALRDERFLRIYSCNIQLQKKSHVIWSVRQICSLVSDYTLLPINSSKLYHCMQHTTHTGRVTYRTLHLAVGSIQEVAWLPNIVPNTQHPWQVVVTLSIITGHWFGRTWQIGGWN